jgi:CRISPR-associated endonuclease/helicase Cas3
MSVLQTKHFFVRLLGLAGKVVIFDEVHAYDAYMNTLFCRLLQWLRQVGASVIVLSATLPQKARKQLLAAWGATEVPDAQYPRLTWANSDSVHAQVVELPSPPKRTLAYVWIGRDTDAIIQKLKDELRQGGCAAVICNTVSRAQQIYEAINSDAFLQTIEADNRILFHARFPLAWREDIETRVLAKFGPNTKDKKLPNPNRPKTAIVVATQVIEQSLDLDFDVMLSDHAPADLLLQRAGRLHRHSANATTRQHPDMLWIAEPQVNDGIPTFARGDVYVYDEYVLLRSWLALKQRLGQQIVLPENVSALIEQVYGEQSLGELPAEIVARLARTKQEMNANIIEAEDKAEESLIREPNYKHLLFKQRNHELDEDNPDLNVAFRALTRLGDPGVNTVCLERIGNELFVIGDKDRERYQPDKVPNKDIVIQLARSIVNVRHRDPSLQSALLYPKSDSEEAAILSTWKKVSALRYCAVAIFKEGEYRPKGSNYLLTLNKEYGLRVAKETP